MSDFETVKQRADIVDVVQGYVALQRSGRNFKACCPFHQERTPSFYVFPERQTWHCFGACSTGGDVFTFIQKKENMEPVEALRLLAERYGVELIRGPRAHDEPATVRLIEANEAAAQFFHNLLLNASAGEPGRRYLEGRGLDAETIRAFQLGYAPDTWDALKDHLLARGFAQPELVAAGLLTEGERGVYDRFRGRVMFPIADERGRIIAFGGRVLGDALPKYLNTPQTPLFDKGGTLYALDRAKDAIRAAGAAVVVEGYMDAIAAHQHGIANVVATLGTALTEQHIRLLKRYARQVVLAMDADAAGIEAALRGEELVRHAVADGDAPAQVVVDWRSLVRVQSASPVEVRVFTVPQGKDPDEAIRTDPAAFRELTRHAVPPFEFRLRHELSAIDRDNPRDRLALADRLLPLVGAVADRAVQAQYLSRLSQATAIAEDVLAARLRGAKPHRAEPPRAAPLALRERVDRPPAAAPPAAPPPGARAEAVCLRLLLSYGSLREHGLALGDDLFTDPACRVLFAAWRTQEPDALHDALDDTGREVLSRVLAERLPPYDEAIAARAFEDAVGRLRLHRLEDRARLLAAAMRESDSSADPSDAASGSVDAPAEGATDRDGADAEMAGRQLQATDLSHELHALETALRTRRTRALTPDASGA